MKRIKRIKRITGKDISFLEKRIERKANELGMTGKRFLIALIVMIMLEEPKSRKSRRSQKVPKFWKFWSEE